MNLFLDKPDKNKPSPVCDFIYRDEAGAEFYTGHSQKERQIMWNLFGAAKYKLKVWGKPDGFLNNQIQDLSVGRVIIYILSNNF